MGQAPDEPPATGEDRQMLARLGGIIGRDTAIYAIAMCLVFPFGLLQVGVVTRYLDPAEYGDLAVVVFFASLLTILMNLVTLQGAFILTYGASGDDGGDDDGGGMDDGGAVDVVEVREGEALGVGVVRDKQLALATGAAVTVVVILLLSVPVLLAAGAVSTMLVGDAAATDLVRWGVLSAAAGACFRYLHNVLRMERRAMMFSAGSLLRPAAVVGLILYFLAHGHGAEGVLMGTFFGSLIAAVFCGAFDRRSFRFGFSWRYAKMIFPRGAPAGWMHVCFFVINSADVFLLSRFAPASQVGVYRLATRLASIPAYFVGAYTMAMIPLDHSPLFRAAYEQRGRKGVKSSLFSYYVIAALGIVLVLTIGADILVLIAAPSYKAAAELVPFLALSVVVFGSFSVILRSSRVVRGVMWRSVLVAVGAILTGGLSILFIPWIGSYGPPLAVIIGMGAVDGALLWLAGRAEDPFVVQWGRFLRVVLSAAIAWAIGTRLAGVAGSLHTVVALIGLALYPALVLLTRAISLDRLRLLGSAGASLLPDRGGRRELVARLDELPVRRRVVLEAVVRDHVPAEQIATQEMIPPAEVSVRLSRAVRQLAGIDAPPETDAAIGDLLLMEGPAAAKDTFAVHLADQGVDMYGIHQIQETFDRLRRAPSAAWRDSPLLLPGAGAAEPGSLGALAPVAPTRHREDPAAS
jgi:O-antigen/teichoic acid export membrane protein